MADPIEATCTSCKKTFVSRNAHKRWKRKDGTWAGNCPKCLTGNSTLKSTVAKRPPWKESGQLTCPRCWLTGPPRPCCELCGGKVYSWIDAGIAYMEIMHPTPIVQGTLF